MSALMAVFWYRVEEMTEFLNEAVVWSSSRIGLSPAMTPITFYLRRNRSRRLRCRVSKPRSLIKLRSTRSLRRHGPERSLGGISTVSSHSP